MSLTAEREEAMKCYTCGSRMVRGVCRSCGRVARNRVSRGGKILTCGRCKGDGRIDVGGWTYVWRTCPVCHGKGKVRV